MLCALYSMERGIGLQRNAVNMRVQFLQSAGRPNECPGGSEHGNEMSYAALGLFPDLIRGGEIMRAPVRVIRILIRIKIKIGMPLGQLSSNFDRAIRAFARIGENDICAVGL